MFRVDKEIGKQRIRLLIVGEISAECIDLIESSCDQSLKGGKGVDLVLHAVTTIDEAGHALLHRLAARGVHLSANGVYYSYLVDTIRQRVSHENTAAIKVLEHRMPERS